MQKKKFATKKLPTLIPTIYSKKVCHTHFNAPNPKKNLPRLKKNLPRLKKIATPIKVCHADLSIDQKGLSRQL